MTIATDLYVLGKVASACILLAGLGWLACRFLKSRPATRHLIAASTLAACLALPTLSYVSLKTGVVLVPIAVTQEQDATESDLVVTAQAVDQPQFEASHPPLLDPGHFREPAKTDWVLVSAFLYGLVTVLSLARLAVGAIRIHRIIKSASPLEPVFADHWALARVDADKPDPFDRICRSNLLQSPVAIGLFRPVLILPAYFDETASAVALRQVFAHETAHINGKHLWFGLLGRLATAFLWPIPFVHWLADDMSRAQEEICDSAAIVIGARTDYARLLLTLSQAGGRADIVGVTCGILSSKFPIRARIATILDTKTRKHTTMKRTTQAAVISGVVATLVALAGTQVVFAQQEPENGSAVAAAAPSGEATQMKTAIAAQPVAAESQQEDQVREQLRTLKSERLRLRRQLATLRQSNRSRKGARLGSASVPGVPSPFEESTSLKPGVPTGSDPFLQSKSAIRTGQLGGNGLRTGTAAPRVAIVPRSGLAEPASIPRNGFAPTGTTVDPVLPSIEIEERSARLQGTRAIGPSSRPGTPVSTMPAIAGETLSAPRAPGVRTIGHGELATTLKVATQVRTPKTVIKQATVIIYDDGTTQIIGGQVEKPAPAKATKVASPKKPSPNKVKSK